MTKNEEETYLLKLWDLNTCPNCGIKISPGKRIGTGKRSQGGFCSLDCFTLYYKLELEQKVELLRKRIQPKID